MKNVELGVILSLLILSTCGAMQDDKVNYSSTYWTSYCSAGSCVAFYQDPVPDSYVRLLANGSAGHIGVYQEEAGFNSGDILREAHTIKTVSMTPSAIATIGWADVNPAIEVDEIQVQQLALPTPSPTPCVIYVPLDYPTIQAAIGAAQDGCEIIVSPGTYYENIHFLGKNIILRSTDPTSPTVVASTIIDGRSTDTVVTFSGTELTTCVLSGFTITSGYAPNGGGIFGNGSMATLQYNNITTNATYRSGWPSGYGGGLCGCDGTILHNTIWGNSAWSKGGGLCQCNGTIQNNIIADNSAYDLGGGLCWCDGTIQNNTISNNTADDGGGLYQCDGTIQHNTISGNWAQNGAAGGLYNCNGIIQNNTICGNSANSGGGLSYCHGTVQNNIICGNSANFGGGGLRDCDGIIQNNTICGNSADYGGGLLSCDGTIQNNIIADNLASNSGGGLCMCDGLIQYDTISGNSAGDDGGGLYRCEGTIRNNTISGNSAMDSGGGLFSCNGFIINCIIWANLASNNSQLYECSTPLYSCIKNWAGGGRGNISADPRFVAPANGDYHLQPGSPCIDAGHYGYLFGEYIIDIDREARIAGSSVDMGSDEYGSSLDSDGDMLADIDEATYGSDPDNRDTDGDGLKDGAEVLRGTNPAVHETPVGVSIPSQFSSIQQGIFLAFPGEAVTVSPGTYHENLHFAGKNVILQSINPLDDDIVNTTIIDGDALFPVVLLKGTENETCAIKGLTIRDGAAEYGAGICGNGALTSIERNKISHNSATRGGGLSWCDGNIQNNIIDNNWPSYKGAGLYNCDGTIQNNIISSNRADYEGGGLIYCDGTIRNNTIWGNRADYGSGLCNCGGTIENNIISGNWAWDYGGGLFGCTGIIQNNIISSNSASDDGGGLSSCHAIIQSNIILNNRAGSSGGGLEWCGGTVQNNTIVGNSADWGGGLSWCRDIIQNNTIWSNTAEDGGGLAECTGTIQNNTIWDNSASGRGGGLFCCTGTIINCIIWQNTAPSGSQLYSCDIPSYSCIQDWTNGGTGNISEDPQLVDPANDDFHLLLSSPCIDAGGTVTLAQDFEGDPRPFDGTIEPRGDGSDFDIGADEYYIPPTPTPTPSPTPTSTPTPLPPLLVISPNGWEVWEIGSWQEIVWEPGDAGESVSIELSRDGGVSWESIAEEVPNSGSYFWRVTSPESNSCLIKISSISVPSDWDISDYVFTIRLTELLELLQVDIKDERILSIAGEYEFLFPVPGMNHTVHTSPTLQLWGAFTQDARGRLSFTGTIMKEEIATSITTKGKIMVDRMTGQVVGKLKTAYLPSLGAWVGLEFIVTGAELNLTITYERKWIAPIVSTVSRPLVCKERGARIIIGELIEIRNNRYRGQGSLILPCRVEMPVTVKERIRIKKDGSLIRRYRIKAREVHKVVCNLGLKFWQPQINADYMQLLRVTKRRIGYVKRVDLGSVWVVY